MGRLTGTGSLVWLASYPKSGNTWMRVFLTNLLRGGAAPVDINELTEVDHAASTARFDELAGVESGDLTPAEIERLRPVIQAEMAAGRTGPRFVKIHDAPFGPASGELLVPTSATRGVLYIVRNPLDVAVSYAHHRDTDVDETIGVMADPGHSLSDRSGSLRIQLPQHLGTWSDHVTGWVDAPGLDVHVARYEDMKRSPLETFAAVAAFAGLDAEPGEIERAVSFSDFRELRRQEDLAGFADGSQQAEAFFRRGEAGAWRDELTPSQIRRIVADHGDVMRRFGYLDPQGRAVVS